MVRKTNQVSPEGPFHPEILPGDKWADNSGVRVIIESCQFNRVKFYREDYQSPCIYPEQRFIKEFSPAKGAGHE
ncbi:TPA: DUF4222 domain-containing protein [Klebsiella pneumoniae]|uniref:DUF4222 domain-containing protein n=1 Tax=Klebsiella quasipneumoniae TaxID=1463165 RepID=UPI0015A7537D|nr:DUF4222 domain-containing protein [Klebsiella quasipneumoniae]EKZ9998768.1 DUF4222 domain-containing protein [Klebsiella pneumoniae]HBU8750156.1 DUF4222 domain-containing protein [Klebsiella pneumoniae]HBW4998638.1 DUF4222 domain-containing protein [Klebsiella pneumoniae]HBW5335213.1 DUF4222 domain-containing protein [Klebsiella pneumoniae]HBW5633237.1 DUF4222 domain-containing protein [Klebsiella pneumoniae]